MHWVDLNFAKILSFRGAMKRCERAVYFQHFPADFVTNTVANFSQAFAAPAAMAPSDGELLLGRQALPWENMRNNTRAHTFCRVQRFCNILRYDFIAVYIQLNSILRHIKTTPHSF
jgi:hypothetical protein